MFRDWKKGDKIFDIYEIHKKISGGMGTIYICSIPNLRGKIAFKRIKQQYISSLEAKKRFLEEANIWVQLENHPCILRLISCLNITEQVFLGMEYITEHKYGNTLRKYLVRKKRLNLKEALEFAFQICEGMIYAQEQFKKAGSNFIHRDLKPENIMIKYHEKLEGISLKITDFGLTIIDHNYTSSSGTWLYMAPELWDSSKKIDGRVDIYAFGCILYEMITGFNPFRGTSKNEIVHNHFNKVPISISKVIQNDSEEYEELYQIIMKCLQKEPENRYKNFKICFLELNTLYLKIFQEIKIIDPILYKKTAPDYLTKAMILFELPNQNNFEEIENLILAALKIEPKYDTAYLCLGRLYSSLGRINEAIKANKNVVKYCSKNVVLSRYDQLSILRLEAAYNSLGFNYLSQNKLKSAINSFKKAIKLNPHDSKNWSSYGIALRRQKKYKEAINAYTYALKLDPKNYESWHFLGILYDLVKAYKKAEHSFKQVIKLNKFYVDTWICLSNIYIVREKYKEAEKFLLKGLKVNPKNADIWNNLGYLYMLINKKKKAENSLKKALKLDPKHEKAHVNLKVLSKYI